METVTLCLFYKHRGRITATPILITNQLTNNNLILCMKKLTTINLLSCFDDAKVRTIPNTCKLIQRISRILQRNDFEEVIRDDKRVDKPANPFSHYIGFTPFSGLWR